MSKTFKTRPASVKVLDDPSWLTERHDHRFGSCDLGERPKKKKKAELRWFGSGGASSSPGGTREPRCFWWFADSFWHQPANGCGCPLCTAQDWRKAERRKQRHVGKADVRTEQRVASGVARSSSASLHDVDDVSGLDDAGYDPWVEEFGNGFEAEVRSYARLAEELALPTGSLVVDVDYLNVDDDPIFDVPSPCEDQADLEPALAGVTVLHNDGTREKLRVRRAEGCGDAVRSVRRGGEVGQVLEELTELAGPERP